MRYNRFLLLSAAVLAAFLSANVRQANSRDLDVSIRHVPYYMFTPGSSARIINVPEPTGVLEQEAAARADAKWVEYCKPKIKVDDFGVGRYQYSKAGCEFGKSAD